ncbi:MAG: transporter [Myxococcaceae bacterium]
MPNKIITAFFLLLSGIQQLQAGACCTSAASFGVGRLLVWEKASSGIRMSAARDLKYPSSLWRTEAWGMVGFSERWSAFATVPWVVPIEHKDDITLSHGIGDVQSGARYQVIQIGEYSELPSLALIGTITFPTGIPGVKNIPSTGRGIWALALGASLEKTWMPWFLQLNLGTTIPVSDRNVSFGVGAQATFVGGLELSHNIVLSGILDGTYEFPMKKLDGSQARAFGYRTSTGLSLAYRFSPHFTLQASAMADLPAATKLSAMLPTYATVSTGLRYGFF